MNPRIGITLGEPKGIGPEIVVRSLAESNRPDVQFFIYGNPTIIDSAVKQWNIQLPPNVTIRSCKPDVLSTLDLAAEEALSKKISALVTAPIDKSIVRRQVPDFTGHTEYLARSAGHVKTLMLLDNGEIRVVLLTEHIPLRDVSRTLTKEKVENSIQLVAATFAEMFGISRPRLAMAGLNPHAGEIVSNAEELTVFAPALKSLRERGIEVDGPFAADSLFPLAKEKKWDALISPYHDQGLVAAKYPGLDKVVNITLGLPYLRVSPGHGVAYDIAGKKPADIRSFQRALRVAIEGKWVE